MGEKWKAFHVSITCHLQLSDKRQKREKIISLHFNQSLMLSTRAKYIVKIISIWTCNWQIFDGRRLSDLILGLRVKRWKEINVNSTYRGTSESNNIWNYFLALMCVISPQKISLVFFLVRKIFSQFLLLSFLEEFSQAWSENIKLFQVISILLTLSVCILSFENFHLEITIKFLRRWVMLHIVASVRHIMKEKFVQLS